MTGPGGPLSERLLAACGDNDEQMASVQRMLNERGREAGAWPKRIDLDPAEQQLLFARQSWPREKTLARRTRPPLTTG